MATMFVVEDSSSSSEEYSSDASMTPAASSPAPSHEEDSSDGSITPASSPAPSSSPPAHDVNIESMSEEQKKLLLKKLRKDKRNKRDRERRAKKKAETEADPVKRAQEKARKEFLKRNAEKRRAAAKFRRDVTGRVTKADEQFARAIAELCKANDERRSALALAGEHGLSDVTSQHPLAGWLQDYRDLTGCAAMCMLPVAKHVGRLQVEAARKRREKEGSGSLTLQEVRFMAYKKAK